MLGCGEQMSEGLRVGTGPRKATPGQGAWSPPHRQAGASAGLRHGELGLNLAAPLTFSSYACVVLSKKDSPAPRPPGLVQQRLLLRAPSDPAPTTLW